MPGGLRAGILRTPSHMLWTLFAWFCVALALLGVVIPGLPTTPFVLLAAWAASRGNRRLHAWLLEHPRLGPPLRDWEQQRAVTTRAKVIALAFLAGSWAIMHVRGVRVMWLVAVGVLFVTVGSYVATRPAPAPREEK